MAKITQVTIINSSTIRLDVDAKANDEINLLEISKIDNSILQSKLNEKLQREFDLKLTEAKKAFETDKENAINKAIDEYKEKLIKLEAEKNSLDDKIRAELNLKHLEELKKLQQENMLLKQANETAIAVTKAETKELYSNQINKLELEKFQLNKDKDDALHLQKDEYEAKLRIQEQEINSLKLAKSSLNIKRLGEELETWCNTEYENYAQCGFENCTWEKDNISVKEEGDTKGTKADYIFKVFASSSKDTNELLTSVACEMKNESPSSTNKKKNSDHYAKLDKDRNKKKCEYALLISELEWDQPNDIPIKKVVGYEKMYMVRPQYFITFLSIITNLGLKYKELLIEDIKVKESFKDSIEIKEEFEKFKTELLDKSLNKLSTELKASSDCAEAIIKSAEKILETNKHIIDKTINSMVKKVDKFNINKLSKMIGEYNKEFEEE